MISHARTSAIGALTVAFALGLPTRALADGPISPYEAETIRDALGATGTTVDADPRGKVIEDVIVRPLDVLEDRDPLPQFAIDFLNALHATTRPGVIRDLLLVRLGETWDSELVEESARRLRGIRQLSLVLIVPVVGSTPDKVKLLVITKDIWSLRLNSDFRVASEGLEYLLLQPAEENLGGIHHSANVRFELEPATYKFGFGYKVPRVIPSEIVGQLSTLFIVNRDTGDFEGVIGGFYYGQPLISTRSEWSWVGSMTVRTETTRFFQGLTPLTFDAEATVEDDRIPIEYETEALAGRIAFVRSFGTSVKHDVLFGAEATRSVFRATHLEDVDEAAAAEFVEAQIPASEQRIYPYVGYATSSTSFASFLDVETLGLQENFRTGHDAYVRSYPVLDTLGSTRTFFGTNLGLSVSGSVGDAFARFYAQSTVEVGEIVYDANYAVGGRLVSPKTPIGRLHADAVFVDRVENFSNRKTTLGGESRLRGYPSGAYRGENVLAYNLEFRSRPAELWTVQLGAAAFFDSAAVWDEDDSPDFKHDVGAGLRLVFPQLERSGMRFDWAVPLDLDPSVGVTSAFPGRFILTFDQAFGFPGVEVPHVAL